MRRQAVAIVASIALLPSAAAAGAAAAPGGVCQGIPSCSVVAFKDVDGDQARDRVGYAIKSPDRAVLRVKTARGRLLSKRLDTSGWQPEGGGQWLGAARIDGRRGVELVVGTDHGAHAILFTVVTYRAGGLVRESVPGPGHLWIIDASVGSFAGVWRQMRNGQAVVTLKSAQRTRGWTYKGENRSYLWRQGTWTHRATVHTTYHGYNDAATINGWHVRGLPTWPAGRP